MCTWSRGGVPGPGGGCTWSQGGVPGPGGCTWSRGCTWSWGGVPGPGGVYLVQGVYLVPRGVYLVRYSPPVNRMTNRCKNITLAKTSFRPVMSGRYASYWNAFLLQIVWRKLHGNGSGRVSSAPPWIHHWTLFKYSKLLEMIVQKHVS